MFLKEINKYVDKGIKHPLHAHIGSKFENFVKTVFKGPDHMFPECQGLPILDMLNVSTPHKAQFKHKLHTLTTKAHSIIFCNEFSSSLNMYFQVVYITHQNQIKIKLFGLEDSGLVKRIGGS